MLDTQIKSEHSGDPSHNFGSCSVQNQDLKPYYNSNDFFSSSFKFKSHSQTCIICKENPPTLTLNADNRLKN